MVLRPALAERPLDSNTSQMYILENRASSQDFTSTIPCLSTCKEVEWKSHSPPAKKSGRSRVFFRDDIDQECCVFDPRFAPHSITAKVTQTTIGVPASFLKSIVKIQAQARRAVQQQKYLLIIIAKVDKEIQALYERVAAQGPAKRKMKARIAESSRFWTQAADKTPEPAPGAKEPLLSHKVYLLLLQPASKKFELIVLHYTVATTMIGDILDLIPHTATEAILGSQRYTGLALTPRSISIGKSSGTSVGTAPCKSSKGKSKSSAPFWTDLTLTASSSFGNGDILVAIPDGYTGAYVTGVSKSILKNPRIQELLGHKHTEPCVKLSTKEEKQRSVGDEDVGDDDASVTGKAQLEDFQKEKESQMESVYEGITEKEKAEKTEKKDKRDREKATKRSGRKDKLPKGQDGDSLTSVAFSQNGLSRSLDTSSDTWRQDYNKDESENGKYDIGCRVYAQQAEQLRTIKVGEEHTRKREERRREREEAKKKSMSEAEDTSGGIIQAHRNDRLERAFLWYTRLAMPSLKEFKRQIATQECIDITAEDVDLLTWNDAETRVVNISTMNAMIRTRMLEGISI